MNMTKLFIQASSTRDFALSKQAFDILASLLIEGGIFDSKSRITFLRPRMKSLMIIKEDNFAFCNDVKCRLTAMSVFSYKLGELRLFIDISKQSLKYVLLHNTKTYAGVPIGHSVIMKESHSTVQMICRSCATISISGQDMWT